MASEPLNGDGRDNRGIPLKSSYPASPPVPALYLGFTTVLTAVGFGIAYAVYAHGATDKYKAKVHLLATYDLGWLYIGAFCIKLGLMAININLGTARKACKVNVPDQQVYKVWGQPTMGYVLMETEGDLGRFNRAQRALMNFYEQYPTFLASFFLCGFVFPFPVFVLVILFMLSRVVAAIGYTSNPDGRMAGNILGGLLLNTMDGFVLLAGVKSLM